MASTQTLTEDWVTDIEDILFENENSFITMSRNHDEFVVNKTVHIPQAGSLAGVTKNRSTFPAVVEQRTDTTLDYTLEDYSVDPALVEDIEELQNSYSKRDSVLFDHKNKLKEEIALNTMFDWATVDATQIVRTSGSAIAGNAPVGATGTRLAFTLNDLINLSANLDLQLVPDDGRRVLLLPTRMYNDLFRDPQLVTIDTMNKKSLPTGVHAGIMGFNIIKRSFVVNYNTGATALNAIGGAVAGTDNSGGIAWHPDFVTKALGSVKMFFEENSPIYFGDILSSQVLFKAHHMRTGKIGIAAIVQAN
tara:strand:+ start:3863 stop:4780 length:918 start_codon:yes stop_codon:yes gene_type:complete